MAEVVYKVDIDSSSIQSKLMQVRMSLEQAVKGAVSGYVGGVGSGLGDPLSSAMGGGMAALQAGMSQQMQRMTIGQQMALGGAQLGMAMSEYGHADFYKQLLLGAAPGASHAALQARMAIGGMASQMPIGAGFGGSAGEIGSFMNQVGTSHANEAGFSEPFLQALQSSNFRNMRTPFRLSGAVEALQNSMWTGRAFGLSGEAIAGDFNSFAAMGMNPSDMQGAFKELQLGRMSGVPEEVLQAQMSRSVQSQMMAQRMGGGMPRIQPTDAGGFARTAMNALTAMQDVDPSFIQTPFDINALAQGMNSLYMASGGRNPTAAQFADLARMRFGNQVAGMDLESIWKTASISNSVQEYELNRSENMAQNQAALSEAFSVKGLLRSTIGSTLGHLPGGLGEFFRSAVGPSEESEEGIRGAGGRVIGLVGALRGVNLGATIEANGLSLNDLSRSSGYAENQAEWDTIKSANPSITGEQRLKAAAKLMGREPTGELAEAVKKGGLSIENIAKIRTAMKEGGTLDQMLGRDAKGKAITERVNNYQRTADNAFDDVMRKAGVSTKFTSDAERLNFARAVDIESYKTEEERERGREQYLKQGGSKEALAAARTAVGMSPSLAKDMTGAYQNLATFQAVKGAMADPSKFMDVALDQMKSGSAEDQKRREEWLQKLKAAGGDAEKVRSVAAEFMRQEKLSPELIATLANQSGTATDKRSIEKVGTNLIKSLGDFIAVVKDISAPRRTK